MIKLQPRDEFTMKVQSNGSVTIPHHIRYRMDIEPGDEIRVIDKGQTLELRVF